MSLKSLILRRAKENRLRRKLTAMAVVAVTLVTIPILLTFLIFDILEDGEEFYNRMKYRAVQIENEVWESGGVSKVSPEFFEGIVAKGEEITVSSTDDRSKHVYFGKKDEEEDLVSGANAEIASFIIEVLAARYEKEIEEVGNLTVHKDETSGLHYMTYKYSFKHVDHTDKVLVKRSVTPTVIKPIEKYQKLFFLSILYIIFFSSIFSYFGLGLIFRLLGKVLDKMFSELEETDYKTRIEVTGIYGKEISGVKHKVNDILERMQKIIEVNIESVQDVSHEVNNKLTSIKQSVDVLRYFGTDDKQTVEKKLKAIDDNVEQITKVMSTILDLAKLDRGAQFCPAEDTNIKEVIDEYMEYMRKVFPEFKFISKCDVEHSIIAINKQHFLLALNPIIENAVRYSVHSNEVVVHIKNVECPNCLYVDIINWGNQIKEEEIPFLFNRYYRGSNLDNSIKGSGLGLTISKKVMDVYNGEINVESSADGKTVFTLSIPIVSGGEGDA
ncbi:TPA: HAMP domain-containing histidine kinase [Bacillus cereus]|nr:HAMP domain-containing histidine kinase [Bacillus cereus]HDR4742407.1 HAMP domain-containing histidine kinase [Bacillus cereus]HDR4747994.1 HAMP domain-containing histidine kinase [Bacillus cereus]HDR4753468.1 HAMP domain-containing histidine kinase [Bacillus cereus]HDR4770677.1 HAMP domain-containing histidine kinase [Bacillus cereus]